MRKVRRLVRRLDAEEYLRIVLYSFAGGVILIRLWLEMLNYPQIGNGHFHVAHVLFGGVILFCGAILPLMFANKWVYQVSAALVGFGSGLFIDEIGKFITSNNDYFYPPAFPIIYALFMAFVIFYLRFRRHSEEDVRYKLYEVLEVMQEVVDFDLEKSEYKRLIKILRSVRDESGLDDYKDLADSLLRFLERRSMNVVSDNVSFFGKILENVNTFFEGFVKKGVYKIFMVFMLEVTGIFSFFSLIKAVYASVSGEFLLKLTSDIFIYGDLIGTQARTWFLIRLFLEGVVGVMLLISGILFLVKKDKHAIDFGQWALVISLIGVNLLLFYFDQLGAVASVLWDYILLFMILRYKEILSKN